MTDAEKAIRYELQYGTSQSSPNYLVEAGAGAGKTYVLVERIVRQLLVDDYSVEDIVAITFTNKSTRELQMRIEKRLREIAQNDSNLEEYWKKIVENNSDIKDKIQKILSQLSFMQISTIHGFCKKMLSVLPFESGIGAEAQKVVRDEEVYIREFIKRDRQANPLEYQRFSKMYLDEGDIVNTFRPLCGNNEIELQFHENNSSAYIDNEKRLLELAQTFYKILYSKFQNIWKHKDKELLNERFVDLMCRTQPDGQGLSREEWMEWITITIYGEYLIFKKYNDEVKNLKENIKYHDKEYSSDSAKSKRDDILSEYAINHPLFEIMLDVQELIGTRKGSSFTQEKKKEWIELAYCMKKLVHSDTMSYLAGKIPEYHEDKKLKGYITEDDLLLYTRNMLKNSQEARTYFHDRYKMIYVDEFQDTDPIQVEILFYLTTIETQFSEDWRKCKPQKGRLFLVGDPKQAIYRFRGADISLYREVKAVFEQDKNCDVVTLHTNFRSDQEICDFADKVFDPDQVLEASKIGKLKEVESVIAADTMSIEDLNKKSDSLRTKINKAEKAEEKNTSELDKFANGTAPSQKTLNTIQNKVNKAKKKLETADESKTQDLENNLIQLEEEKNAQEDKVYELREKAKKKLDDAKKDLPLLKKQLNEYEKQLVNAKARLQYTEKNATQITNRAIQSLKMDDTDYQVGYASMISEHSKSGKSIICSYDSNSKDDPQNIRTLIQTMISGKTIVGVKEDKRHEIQYQDILVLTKVKSHSEKYAQEFRANDIPCMVDGEQKLSEIPQIQLGLLYLEVLANPTDDLVKMELLREGYEIDLFTITRFLHFAECDHIYKMFRDIEQVKKVKKQVCGASDIDTRQRDKLLELCDVLTFLIELLSRSSQMPPMGVVEWMFDNRILADCKQIDSLNKNSIEKAYGYVQQFLNALRLESKGTMESLYEQACIEAEKKIEIPLALEASSNCVRIMNLHKAKGLEANVVILAYENKKEYEPSNHIEREGMKTKRYQKIEKKVGKNIYLDIGIPPMWTTESNAEEMGKSNVESAFLEAEKARLLYVAVTRAETMLIISNSPEWEVLTKYCDDISKSAEKSTGEVQADKTSDKEDPGSTTDNLVVAADEKQDNEENVPVILNLKKAQAKVCESQSFSITPSKLDHKAPRNNDDVSNGEDTENNTEKHYKPNEEGTPYGPSWGTIVHRVLELALRAKHYDDAALMKYAKQAIRETVSETLNSEQAKLLWKQKGRDLTEEMITDLSETVVKAISFLQNSKSELRQLISDGTVFPEMSFFTSQEDGDLYNHLCQHMQKVELNGKRLDVQGIIDLAILEKDGWYVVDYKTDRIRADESKEEYCERLRSEYNNQIGAYGKLLEMATNKPVLGMYLCSIPLGGKCIPLGDSPSMESNVPEPLHSGTVMPTTKVYKLAELATYGKVISTYNNQALDDIKYVKKFNFYIDGELTPLFQDEEGKLTYDITKCIDFVCSVVAWINYQKKLDVKINVSGKSAKNLIKELLKTLDGCLDNEEWNQVSIGWTKIMLNH